MVKLDNKYSKIPFETINMVRKFKINNNPSKLECKHNAIKQTKVNKNNLVTIHTNNEKKNDSQNIRIATINTHSIENKVELVIKNSIL